MTREYPKVWSSFQRVAKNGKTLSFEIKDVPEDLWIEAVEFMLGNYIREDVWWITAGTAGDPQAIEEYRVLLTSIIKLKMSLGCFLVEESGGRVLVGMNMCMPQEKERFVEHNPPKTKAGLLSLRMFSEAVKVPAIYDKYNVDVYLMGAGLSVTPEYRGLGLAVELLKSRMLLTKEGGLSVTGGIFTSAPAQRSAEKAGMDCVYQIPYKQFGEQCNIDFNTTTEDLKIFAIKV
ncbi:unnamed protein product [Danaus chrysippus]|uniref:(African queen) hypothetical protein n=1 Tax=Danaus chrysippus TaxID=151541 RepID=A0A8J2QDL2_9NEOP|nr:unnamed protein product [Danaus chrysippus]